ncbi:MAG: peptide-methionine (S)-S-oxide reductase [Saprospiraceae bacterium]|jgi:peptide-methionine (S)-S-oxide reductase
MPQLSYLLALALSFSMCSTKTVPTSEDNSVKQVKRTLQKGQSSSVFASGCFWCVEAVFESVEGVSEAVSGYAGGSAEDANYSAIGSGRTGHAEAVEVFYDPKVVSYETLLKVFFGSQDPTTLNQQGPDRGTQYRSTIFYKNEAEKLASEKYIAELTKNNVFDGVITTTLEPLVKFYDAEDYHQDYEARNPNQPYVKGVSVPRLNKFKSKFPELLKKGKSKH